MNDNVTSHAMLEPSVVLTPYSEGDFLLPPDLTSAMLCELPGMFLLLNRHLYVTFANQALRRFTGIDLEPVAGLRLGEVLGCINTNCTVCGQNEECKNCELRHCLEGAKAGRSTVGECRLKGVSGATEFRVYVTPLPARENSHILLSLEDIREEKRRNILERIFFHDVLNTAGNLRAAAELFKLRMADPDQMIDLIYKMSRWLVEEIQSQRELSAAESGDLTVHPVLCNPLDVLTDVAALYRTHNLAREKKITIVPVPEPCKVLTDMALLRRVLGNLLKNALEASALEQTVTISLVIESQYVVISVHNSGCISEDVRSHVFSPFYSTKGFQRGLGTYSVKLLTERYLRGQSWFNTSEEEGTTFSVRLPRAS